MNGLSRRNLFVAVRISCSKHLSRSKQGYPDSDAWKKKGCGEGNGAWSAESSAVPPMCHKKVSAVTAGHFNIKGLDSKRAKLKGNTNFYIRLAKLYHCES